MITRTSNDILTLEISRSRKKRADRAIPYKKDSKSH